MQPPISPLNERELLDRARQLAGQTLAAIATHYQQPLVCNLNRSKGFVGDLIEYVLGASAGNISMPDFPHLGIELKTLPINQKGQPLESTYVCTTPRITEMGSWQQSRVRQKLLKVLWVPIEAEATIPLAHRRIGTPVLWQMPPPLETILQADWEELVTCLSLGQLQRLSAKMGTYLQVRPKAAHSRIAHARLNEEGTLIHTNPQGFYLRTSFTKMILEKSYCLPISIDI